MISTKQKDFVAGGGILEDTDALILRARYILSTERPEYQKNVRGGKVNTMAAILVRPYGPDGEGKEEEVLYSIGESSRIIPTADGLLLDAAPGAPAGVGVVNTSNFAQFCASWETHDPVTDRDLPGVGLSALEGFRVHFMRVEQPKRKGMETNIPGQTKARPDSVVLVSKIHGKGPIPAAAGAAPAAVAPVAQTAVAAPAVAAPATAAPAPSGVDQGFLQEVLMNIVATGPVAKNQLATKAFAAVQGKYPDPGLRNAALRVLVDEGFLKNSPVNFDGTTVSALG